MSKTLIIISAIFFVVSILVNIFASVLEKIVEKKKLDTIRNNKVIDNIDKKEN